MNLRPGDYKVMIHGPDAQLAWHGGEIVHVAPGKTVTADFQVAPFRKGRWRRYSTANGLPSSSVHDLQFTPDGMLWLATQNGVSRFDGLTFTNLSKRNGLIDNRVYCIHREKSGLLWFGTEDGASRFDPATGRFENFPSGTNGLTAGRVMRHCGDAGWHPLAAHVRWVVAVRRPIVSTRCPAFPASPKVLYGARARRWPWIARAGFGR